MSFLSESKSSESSRGETDEKLKENRELTIEFLKEMMTDEEVGMHIKQVSVYARLLTENDTNETGHAAAAGAAGMMVFSCTANGTTGKSVDSQKKMCEVYHSMAMVKLEGIKASCLLIERFATGIAFRVLSIIDFKQFLKKEKFYLISKTKTKSVPTMNLINLIKRESEISYHAWWQNCLILSAKILAICQVPWEGLEKPEGKTKETIRMLRIINEHLGNYIPFSEGSWMEMAMVGYIALGSASKRSESNKKNEDDKKKTKNEDSIDKNKTVTS